MSLVPWNFKEHKVDKGCLFDDLMLFLLVRLFLFLLYIAIYCYILVLLSCNYLGVSAIYGSIVIFLS